MAAQIIMPKSAGLHSATAVYNHGNSDVLQTPLCIVTDVSFTTFTRVPSKTNIGIPPFFAAAGFTDTFGTARHSL